MTKLKDSIESLDSRGGQAEERITKFKDRPFEIIQSEKKISSEYTFSSYGTPLRKIIFMLLESEKKKGRKG